VAGWRRKALELFPERAAMLRRPDGIHTVLAELFGDLRAAYGEVPPNHDLIERVYRFVAWCFAPKQNHYLRNAAAVSFYEHAPDFGPARADLAAQFTPAMWAELQPLLYRMLPPASYDAFETEIGARGLDCAAPTTRRAT
jgi:hypothetical protein